MIKFEGNVGWHAKKYIFVKLLICCLICTILGIFLLISLPSMSFLLQEHKTFIFLFVGAIVVGVVIIVVCLVSWVVPVLVEIDDVYIMATYRDKGYRTRKIEHVEKVIDKGAFYVFKFNSTNGWGNCICQKDLMVEGTIEQFEEMFKEKIIRKTKNK